MRPSIDVSSNKIKERNKLQQVVRLNKSLQAHTQAMTIEKRKVKLSHGIPKYQLAY
jgi:hypothetical protein